MTKKMPLTRRRFPLVLSHTAILTVAVSTAAHAETATDIDNHTRGALDPTAPIAALTTLSSLQETNPSLQVKTPDIIHFTTPAGTPVSLVQTHTVPIVDISIYFNAGAARDDAIKQGGYGIASLTATMLDQGTQTKNDNDIAEAIEQLGAELTANAYKDMFIVSLRTLSDEAHLRPATDLMSDILSHPTFPADNLARSKAQYLISLAQEDENPDSIAAKAFAKALYGNHPYAHPTKGTKASIAHIEQADLQAFAQQFLVARNAHIAITGDISAELAKDIAQRLTQALPAGTPAPKLPDAKPLTHAKTIHIPFDSSQTTVIMGQLGSKHEQDATRLQQRQNFAIVDEVVGGGNFQARLMQEVRKKRGLTYGIYSNMTPMQSQGSYTIRFSTRNDKSAEAIQATQQVLKETVQHGISAEELTLTKDSLTNSFPTSFASNAAINATIGMMGFYQLPDSYLTDYIKRLQQADLHSVNQSYASLIDPAKFLIVTVGNTRTTIKTHPPIKKPTSLGRSHPKR